MHSEHGVQAPLRTGVSLSRVKGRRANSRRALTVSIAAHAVAAMFLGAVVIWTHEEEAQDADSELVDVSKSAPKLTPRRTRPPSPKRSAAPRPRLRQADSGTDGSGIYRRRRERILHPGRQRAEQPGGDNIESGGVPNSVGSDAGAPGSRQLCRTDQDGRLDGRLGSDQRVADFGGAWFILHGDGSARNQSARRGV